MNKPNITEGEWEILPNLGVINNKGKLIADTVYKSDAQAIRMLPQMIKLLIDIAYSIEHAKLNSGGVLLGDDCERDVIEVLKKAGCEF